MLTFLRAVELELRPLWSLKLMKADLQDQQIEQVNCECCTEYAHAVCKGLGQDRSKVNLCLPVH